MRITSNPHLIGLGRVVDDPGANGGTNRAVGSLFDHQPHTSSRLEEATRPYQRPESLMVRFWLRKSV
jgi:hypothetical protein